MFQNKNWSLFIIHLVSLFLVLLIQSTIQVYAQNTDKNGSEVMLEEIFYTINWDSMSISTDVHITWTPSNQQYINPSLAHSITQSLFPQIISSLTKHIYINQQDTLLDFARQHSIYQSILSHILANVIVTSQIPDKNLLGITFFYHISLITLEQTIILPALMPIPLPSLPYPQSEIQTYSSIIFSVTSPLDIISTSTNNKKQGYYAPKILPMVYASNRNTIVYTPEYFIQQDLYNRAYTYIYSSDYQDAPTGSTPLFIIPLALDNEIQGDLIISEEDTRRILASDSARTLITQGKVFFIIMPPTKQILK